MPGQIHAVLDLAAGRQHLAERDHRIAGIDRVPEEAARDGALLHQLAGPGSG